MIAYTVNTLFYVYLKTKGEQPAHHPVTTEIQRIKTYFKKLKHAQNQAESERGAQQLMQGLMDASTSGFQAQPATTSNEYPRANTDVSKSTQSDADFSRSAAQQVRAERVMRVGEELKSSLASLRNTNQGGGSNSPDADMTADLAVELLRSADAMAAVNPAPMVSKRKSKSTDSPTTSKLKSSTTDVEEAKPAECRRESSTSGKKKKMKTRKM